MKLKFWKRDKMTNCRFFVGVLLTYSADYVYCNQSSAVCTMHWLEGKRQFICLYLLCWHLPVKIGEFHEQTIRYEDGKQKGFTFSDASETRIVQQNYVNNGADDDLLIFSTRQQHLWYWLCMICQVWYAMGKGRCSVIKWKHFPRYWSFVRGIHRSPVNSLTKASDAEVWCFLWSAPV